MSTHTVIENLSNFCKTSSGDPQIWVNKGTTYHWNRGRDSSTGIVNGVVRKLAGIDASGKQIWVVAGSFKITPEGEIIRFTGLPKKTQVTLNAVSAPAVVTQTQTDTVTV
jgi:hypothetical protein